MTRPYTTLERWLLTTIVGPGVAFVFCSAAAELDAAFGMLFVMFFYGLPVLVLIVWPPLAFGVGYRRMSFHTVKLALFATPWSFLAWWAFAINAGAGTEFWEIFKTGFDYSAFLTGWLAVLIAAGVSVARLRKAGTKR